MCAKIRRNKTKLCSMWWVWMLPLSRGLASTRCSLEDKGFCDFSPDVRECTFSDVSDEDMSTSVMDVLNGRITARKVNRGCRQPRAGDGPFTVKIEPCFHNGSNPMSTSETVCSDPGKEYFLKHLRAAGGILSNETETSEDITNSDFLGSSPLESPHVMQGEPVDVKIVRIGKAFVLGG